MNLFIFIRNLLTDSLAEPHQVGGMVLDVVIAAPVTLAGHFGASSQATDNEEGEQRKSYDA